MIMIATTCSVKLSGVDNSNIIETIADEEM